VQKQIAVWNTDLKLWTKPNEVLFSEHLELFSGTWPTSGMTQSGVAYELPKQVPHTNASEYSSLPTPTTQDSSGQCRDHGGDLLHEVICGCPRSDRKQNLFPTPVASEGTKAPSQQTSETKSKTGQVWLSNVAKDLSLLPTATASDWKNGIAGDGYGPNLPQTAKQLLATPQVDDGKNTGHNQTRRLTLASQVWANHKTNWGKFDPAIRRWESIIGRPAPEPTKPDGKDNNHRLSSKFTEWMMGLPDGWITGHDLKRNDELKLAGNGVVPQQAELALRLLLELPERKENDNE
jgi:DNA (cytosine-5)-methyltransferase 1